MFQLKRPTEGNQPTGFNDLINVKVILGKLLANWYLFAIGLVLAMGIAVFKVKTADKIYAVKAKMLLGDPADKNSTVAILESAGVNVTSTGVDDEIAMITSSNTIENAIMQLDFGISYYHKDKFKTSESYGNFPYTIVLDSTKRQMVGIDIAISLLSGNKYQVRIKGEQVNVMDMKDGEVADVLETVLVDDKRTVGQPYISKNLNFRVEFSRDAALYDQGEYIFKINTLESLVNKYGDKLSVKPMGKETKVIELSSSGSSISKEKKFLNEVMQAHINRDLREKLQVVDATLNHLDGQIATASDAIQQTSQDIARAGGSSDLKGLSFESRDIAMQISTLENERSNMNIRINYYQDVLNRVSNGEVNVAAPASLNVSDPILTNLLMELSQASRDLAVLRREVTPNHPQIPVLELRLDNARSAVVSSVSTSISASRGAVSDFSSRISSLQGQRAGLAGRELNTGVAESMGDINSKNYETLLELKAQLGMRMSSMQSDIRVIEWAKLEGDGPISPNPFMIYLIAIAMGLGLPLGFIVVREFMDNRVKGGSDIETSTSIPILGFIAKHDKNSNYIVDKNSRTPLAESFRAVRIKLQYLESNVEKKVIGLTSSASGEGKTFCIANLAAIYSQAGKRVLIIDVDLRRPRVGRYFDFKDERGLSNYLSEEVDNVFDLIQTTHVPNLDVLGSGPISSNPLDLLSGARMANMMQQLRKEYDHIFLDTPPLGMVSDYLILMTLTDYNIYIVRHERTSVEALNWINQLYESGKIKNLSILINDVKTLAAYGYIDKYYGYGDNDEE